MDTALLILLTIRAVAASGAIQCSGLSEPHAVVKQGTLRGVLMKSLHERTFCAFMGVPFAKPPVGDLRFKPPMPAEPWNNMFNATSDAPVCVQVFNGIVTGQEDCLYLNVYTPALPGNNSVSKNLPVMVYIVGGGFFFGAGASYVLGPQYLLDKDIVLVTINYRVGPLGFFSTGDNKIPANLGLKDQTAALRWVRDNIAAFGGDPKCVTLFGGSAGGACVHYHMISPMSRGLFHRAICQSGLAPMWWARPFSKDPLQISRQQAELVGCWSKNTSFVLNCLSGLDAVYLINVTKPISTRHMVFVEPPTSEDPQYEAFLPKDPLVMLKEGHFSYVPWIVGTNSDEGIFWVHPLLKNESLRYEYNLNEEYVLNQALSLESSVNPEEFKNIREAVLKFYDFEDPDTPFANKSLDKLIQVYGDRGIYHGTHLALILHLLAGHNPIYKYNFGYRGRYSLLDGAHKYGVEHGDETIYLFKTPAKDNWPSDHPDRKVIDLLITLWTNFAKYGNPQPDYTIDDKRFDVKWLPVTGINSLDYLHIEKASGNEKVMKFSMRTNLYAERMRFWDSLPLTENAFLPRASSSELKDIKNSGNCVRMTQLLVAMYASIRLCCV